jgi:hypothetical protein
MFILLLKAKSLMCCKDIITSTSGKLIKVKNLDMKISAIILMSSIKITLVIKGQKGILLAELKKI